MVGLAICQYLICDVAGDFLLLLFWKISIHPVDHLQCFICMAGMDQSHRSQLGGSGRQDFFLQLLSPNLVKQERPYPFVVLDPQNVRMNRAHAGVSRRNTTVTCPMPHGGSGRKPSVPCRLSTWLVSMSQFLEFSLVKWISYCASRLGKGLVPPNPPMILYVSDPKQGETSWILSL